MIIENVEDVDAAVTGQIVNVLFADDVKQLKKKEGVWPPEFMQPTVPVHTGAAADGTAGTGSSAVDVDAVADDLDRRLHCSTDADADAGKESSSSSSSEEDDSLPALVKIQNRKIIEYAVSESDSDD